MSILSQNCFLMTFAQLEINQIVQAHTILQSVSHKYEDKPVLVLGGRNDDVRKVAEGSVQFPAHSRFLICLIANTLTLTGTVLSTRTRRWTSSPGSQSE